jgi:hypothetical protein
MKYCGAAMMIIPRCCGIGNNTGAGRKCYRNGGTGCGRRRQQRPPVGINNGDQKTLEKEMNAVRALMKLCHTVMMDPSHSFSSTPLYFRENLRPSWLGRSDQKRKRPTQPYWQCLCRMASSSIPPRSASIRSALRAASEQFSEVSALRDSNQLW